MDRVLIASVLGVALAACGPSATRGPAQTVVTTRNDDVTCTDDASPSGMTHRVCRPQAPASVATREAGVPCVDEVPTDHVAGRACPARRETDADKHIAQPVDLAPWVRLRVETGGADRHPKIKVVR